MAEVTARLRFSSLCYGNVKKRMPGGSVYFMMPRTPDGHVMFLPTWWKMSIRDAAKLLNRHQELVKQIDWDPAIDSESKPRLLRREIRKTSPQWFATHEAFAIGSIINVHAALPSGISLPEFSELMSAVGSYRGISPFYRRAEQYGTFTVLSVTPRHRNIKETVPDEVPAPTK